MTSVDTRSVFEGEVHKRVVQQNFVARREVSFGRISFAVFFAVSPTWCSARATLAVVLKDASF